MSGKVEEGKPIKTTLFSTNTGLKPFSPPKPQTKQQQKLFRKTHIISFISYLFFGWRERAVEYTQKSAEPCHTHFHWIIFSFSLAAPVCAAVGALAALPAGNWEVLWDVPVMSRLSSLRLFFPFFSLRKFTSSPLLVSHLPFISPGSLLRGWGEYW